MPKKLEIFQKIFVRNDFNYISNSKAIKKVQEVILEHVSKSDGKESSHIRLLEEYLENLNSFYTSVNGRSIADINDGQNIITKELRKWIKVLSSSKSKDRNRISKAYCKKSNKRLFYGLHLIYAGLYDLFKLNGGISLGNNYFANYLIDNVIGLGSKYLFNQEIIDDIRNNKFGKSSLIQFLHNLTRRHKIRSIGNEWEKYGVGRGDRYRAYGSQKEMFKKIRIYFLIPNNPKLKKKIDEYVKNKRPEDVKFHKAA